MNKVELMGRITKDLKMQQTDNNKMFVRFSIAVNRRFVGKDAQQQADFINCVAWQKTGEIISKYFKKGSMIAVIGSIQSRSWEGQDGKKQYSTEVVVDEVYFTGEKSKMDVSGSSEAEMTQQ